MRNQVLVNGLIILPFSTMHDEIWFPLGLKLSANVTSGEQMERLSACWLQRSPGFNSAAIFFSNFKNWF